MTARVTLLTGPARTGKTARLLERYREALRTGRPQSTLWLAPTWRSASVVRQRLLTEDLTGCFAPGVMTFDQLAEVVVQSAPRAVRSIGAQLKRQLIRRLLNEMADSGRLRYFQPILATAGLVDMACELIGRLKKGEIWPEQFREACRTQGMTARDEELASLYEAYQQRLNDFQLYDSEGRFWTARVVLEQGLPHTLGGLRVVVVDGFADFTAPQHAILQHLADRVDELWITLPLEADTERVDLFAKSMATQAELQRRHPGMIVEWTHRRPAATGEREVSASRVSGEREVSASRVALGADGRSKDQGAYAPRSPAARGWPAMDFLEANLFRNPRLPVGGPAPDDMAGVEILAASRTLGEIELIGSRIKRLLVAGDDAGRPVRAGEVAVVFRSLGDVEDLVREVFTRLGIPFALEAGPTLDGCPEVKALAGVLRLDQDDWPFRQLLAVLGNVVLRGEAVKQRGVSFQLADSSRKRGKLEAYPTGFFHNLEAEGDIDERMAAECVVRRLQIPRGRARLLELLERKADNDEARTALAVLRHLAEAIDALPKQVPLGQWAEAWGKLAGQLGIVEEAGGDACRRQDFGILLDSLAEGDRLAAQLGWEPVIHDRRQALSLLLDTARHVRSRCPSDESGRVRVLGAPSVRAMQVPYLFFAGLAEKSFPAPEPSNRLYSRAEEERLVRAGLPLSAAGLRHSEEMLLFYEVLTRATRRLWFSYPAMDESGQPLSPSPFLDEVEQVCGPGRIRRTVVPDLSPIPAHDDPLSPEEFRVKAVAAALEGDVSLLAGLVRGDAVLAGDNLLAGLRTTHAREDRNAFGPMEGMLDGDAARRQLAARFGADTSFSPTELERYAACPFRFLFEKVLRLHPLDDLTLEIDYQTRGQRVHEVLSAFHQEVNRQCGGPASPASLDEAQYQALLTKTLDAVFGPGELAPLARAFREIDRKLLELWTAEYRRQHAAYDGLWPQCQTPPRPAWFEVSFGMECSESPSTERPLVLDTPAGPVRIVGRIDRIDLGTVAGRPVFNVLDYKTSATAKFNPEGVADGTCLQLPLYALATETLLLADRQAAAWQAGYWPLLSGGFKPKQALVVRDGEDDGLEPRAEWEAIREAAARTVGAIVACLREGRFPVYNADEHCTRNCSFSTLCRINQIRSLEKTWQLPVQD